MCAQDRSAVCATAAEKGTELCGGRELSHNAQSIATILLERMLCVCEEVPFIIYRSNTLRYWIYALIECHSWSRFHSAFFICSVSVFLCVCPALSAR